MKFKKTIIRAVILMGIAMIVAMIINVLSPKGIALKGQWDTKKGVISAKSKNDIVNPDLEIGNIEKVKAIYDQRKAIFVDARSEDDFKDGHIKGAVTIPLYSFDQLIGNFKKQYSQEKYIITYCSGRTCEDSHHLAQLFMEQGFMNISIFIDGFPAWQEKGYPIE